MWMCLGDCFIGKTESQCPPTCETCVLDGKGSGCLSDCSPCSRACQDCINGQGGKACSSLCRSGKQKLSLNSDENMLQDVLQIEQDNGVGLRGSRCNLKLCVNQCHNMHDNNPTKLMVCLEGCRQL